MKAITKKLVNISRWSIGVKLTIAIFISIALLLVVFFSLINRALIEMAENSAAMEIQEKTLVVSEMLNTFDKTLYAEVDVYAKVFIDDLGSNLRRDTSRMLIAGGVASPALTGSLGDLNGNLAITDNFTEKIGGVTSIFVRDGDDFVRITTSLKDEQGKRVIGVKMDRTHPGYQILLTGKNYTGYNILYGKQFINRYDPIKDAQGNVIGVVSVGLDFTHSSQQLFETIAKLKIGTTGYFYAFDTAGIVTMHPTLKGQAMLDLKDPTGYAFVRDMLAKREGIIRYVWPIPGQPDIHREKISAFMMMPTWNWVIVGSTFSHEYTHFTTDILNNYRLIGLTLLIVIGFMVYWFMRKYLSIPLGLATDAANTLANGDLRVNLEKNRNDEIGDLITAINGIGKNLSKVVNQVRSSSSSIALATQEIALGNADLSNRTESQASSLEETSASMQEMTDNVRKSADTSAQANSLTSSAAQLAAQGGDVTNQVLETMENIKESSTKIVDIISMIDGIAFQTNILALNAAVEAARAGEQGRGFAVVASEVRTLAQRSANAAKEIAALINDSVAKIETGNQLSHKTTQTMKEIVRSVNDVSHLVAEINVSTNEQNLSIGQINDAVAQMDQMTQHNAALVEESAAAAESLQEEAAQLVKIVQAFKTQEADNSPRHSSGPSAPLPPAKQEVALVRRNEPRLSEY